MPKSSLFLLDFAIQFLEFLVSWYSSGKFFIQRTTSGKQKVKDPSLGFPWLTNQFQIRHLEIPHLLIHIAKAFLP